MALASKINEYLPLFVAIDVLIPDLRLNLLILDFIWTYFDLVARQYFKIETIKFLKRIEMTVEAIRLIRLFILPLKP